MLKNRNIHLAKNVAIFALGNLGTKIISFFLVPVYTNALTASQYGTIDLVNAIGLVMIPLLTCNIAEAVVRFCMDDDANLNSILCITLSTWIIALLIGLCFVPVLLHIELLREYALLVYLCTVTTAGSQLFLYYLRGREQLLKYSIGNLLYAILVALLNIVFLLWFNWGISGYFLAYILSNTIVMLYAFLEGRMWKYFLPFNIDYKLFGRMVKYSAYLIPNSVMWWIINSSDRIMLSAMVNNEANGIFSIAYRVPTLLSSLTMIFTQAWSYTALDAEKSEDRIAYNNLVFDKVVSFVYILAAALLLVTKPFMKIYVEASFFEAWKYVPLLTIGFVFNTISTFIGTSYTVQKDSKGAMASATAGAIVNLVLNFCLINTIGIAGAASATAISYIVVFVYRAIDTRKYLPLHILQKKHIVGIVVLLLMAASVYIEGKLGQCLLIFEFALMIINARAIITKIFALVNKWFKRS